MSRAGRKKFGFFWSFFGEPCILNDKSKKSFFIKNIELNAKKHVTAAVCPPQ